MLHGSLALLIRSLRMDARLARGHLIRLGFAALILAALVWAHITSLAFAAPGLSFFRVITYLNFAFITIAGFSLFATAITEEKEEGTLGLLKMAGISRLGILLGKSTTRLITAIMLLLVQLPFTLLAITLGGITFGQIAATYWGLFAYMVLVANVGLLCSVVSKRSSDAGTLSALLLGLFLAGVPGLQGYIAWLKTKGTKVFQYKVPEQVIEFLESFQANVLQPLSDASVYNRLDVFMATGFAESPFSEQVVGNLIAACVFFVLAWIVFDRFTRENVNLGTDRRMLFKRTSRLSRIGVNRAWSNPLIWKDFHFITGGKPAMFAKFVFYGLSIPAIGLIIEHFEGSFSWYYLGPPIVFFSMLAFIAVELCFYASRIFHDELKWKTHGPLMMLPMSPTRIAYSKVAGCLLGLIPASTYLVLGMLLGHENFLFENILLSPQAWSVLVQFIVFLHLTAYLSLIVKWGAMPLAIATLFFVNTCLLSWVAVIPMMIVQAITGEEEAAIMPIIYFGAVVVAILQFLIRQRLHSVASQ